MQYKIHDTESMNIIGNRGNFIFQASVLKFSDLLGDGSW